MDIDNARTGDVRLQETADPRTRLAQEKFFTQRPKPLERWLWRQRVAAAAGTRRRHSQRSSGFGRWVKNLSWHSRVRGSEAS